MKFQNKVLSSLFVVAPLTVLPITIVSCSSGDELKINKVLIDGIKEPYKDGEEIKLIAKVEMSDGSQIPTEGVAYKWILQDQVNPVSTSNTYSEVASIAKHNEKTIRLEVVYNGQTISSDPIKLIVLSLADEINRFDSLKDFILKQEPILQSDFNQIDDKNIIDKIASDLKLDKNLFDYQAIDFNKTSNKITFKIQVAIKGDNATDKYQTINKLFTVTFNVHAEWQEQYILIEGLKDTPYTINEPISLQAKVISTLDGTEIPTEGLTYEWFLNDTKQKNTTNSITLNSWVSRNNNIIKLIVTNNGKKIESTPITLKIDSLPTYEIKRINEKHAELKGLIPGGEIAQNDFNLITEKSLNDAINKKGDQNIITTTLSLRQDLFKYAISNFKKDDAQGKITFSLEVGVKLDNNNVSQMVPINVSFDIQYTIIQ